MKWKNSEPEHIRILDCTRRRPSTGITRGLCHDNLNQDNRVKLFPGKLKSCWSGPFEVARICLNGTVDVKDIRTGTTFKSMDNA
ncbi:NEDD8 ultimate buster 1-like [Gossypium australe]|uniref:NEDD8 ultimate buster 1-like n=1 Tax=Gossypium australe TaxID=47621 RepID=A0A5B6X301_9ROSI|nr:NEDD8 ultimate buster 1-like [Gossypium australe]